MSWIGWMENLVESLVLALGDKRQNGTQLQLSVEANSVRTARLIVDLAQISFCKEFEDMSSFEKRIKEDNKDVKKMVLAAKCGNWDDMNEVLNKKPHLVNCIPEERTWGILHQAVYWNDLQVVTDILNVKTCDALIKTKECADHIVGPGKQAVDIADAMGGRSQVKKKINDNIKNERSKRFSLDIPYQVTRKDGEKTVKQLPLFIREMAMYKETLFSKDEPVKGHLIDLLKQIFKNEEFTFNKVEQQLHQSLYGYDKNAADEICFVDEEKDFFSELIKLYTGCWVHKELNEALSREFKADYNPEAKDLALGLYGMLFDITITFWKDLGTTSDTTWRGVSNQFGNFKVGQEIMFTSFVSSSGDEDVARGFAGSNGTLFKIDNRADATTRPKHIKEHSQHKSEDEYVYAIGTEFEITQVIPNASGLRIVQLELLTSCVLCRKP